MGGCEDELAQIMVEHGGYASVSDAEESARGMISKIRGEIADMILNDEVIARYTIRDATGLHMAPLYMVAKTIRETKTEWG